MQIAEMIILILLAVSLIAAAFLLARMLMLQKERIRLENELAQAEQQVNTLTATLSDRDKQIAVVKETQRQLEIQFEQTQKQARETFKAVAGDALKQANEQFLQLARKSFDSEKKDVNHQLDQRKQAIESLVKPINERLEKYDQFIRQIEAARKQAYGQLNEQVRLMGLDQKQLQIETANLVKALRRPETRGRWGEIQLKRVAELAGMIDNCDFEEQATVETTEGKKLRPDMTIHLPAGRKMIVDAKTPIDAYLTAIEADSDLEKQENFTKHVEHIRAKVKELSGKDYHELLPGTPGFVILFIPGECFLQSAIERRPRLMEEAMERGVVISTPSTLISLLKTVALGWREEQLAENAEKIRAVGVELHKRLCTALGHLNSLGKSIEKTSENYNNFIGSLERNVMVQARRFEDLGIKSKKQLPDEIRTVDNKVNELKNNV